jgi:hypothetical protein
MFFAVLDVCECSKAIVFQFEDVVRWSNARRTLRSFIGLMKEHYSILPSRLLYILDAQDNRAVVVVHVRGW